MSVQSNEVSTSLLLLLEEVRGKTLKLTDGVSEAAARWAPPSLCNHILWHSGHAYVVLEALTMDPIGRPRQIPAGWFEMFSWESDPRKIAEGTWPKLAEVRAALTEQQQRVKQLLESLDAAALNQPAVHRKDAKAVRWYIMHALYDEATHGGEIRLLKKLMRPLV